MVETSKEKIYCAIDIEATGFDPLTEEILEIGFIFFRHAKKSFQVLEEWSQIFKPAKQVSSKILGLTGITEAEIASAPALAEFHDFVQQKLDGAVLVGHSVGVDVRYLEANGFKLSGKYIDTLELVQFILPTRHSYNLENLMHYFSIEHKSAHRALEDARASMLLLESLLGSFKSFPEEVQEKVKAVTAGFDFVWHPLLSGNFKAGRPVDAAEVQAAKPSELNLDIIPNAILNFNIDHKYREAVLEAAAGQEEAYLFATPFKNEVLELWKKGLGIGIFSAEDSFDPEKFKALLGQKQTNPDLAKFLAKVAVWHGTNWQTRTILDLNLSFAGNQFRFLVSGREEQPQPAENILLCDHRTLLSLKANGSFSKRRLIVEGLSEFESQLSAKIGKKASWGSAIRMLYSIYNPETGFGEAALAKDISDLLAATDLFFGLSALTLEGAFLSKQQVRRQALEENAKAYRTVEQAARNYARKLENFAAAQKYDAFKIFAISLLSFFEEAADRVKWIEFGPHFCIFNNLPLRIEKLARNSLEVFAAASFVDTLGENLIAYYQKRMGLENYTIKDLSAGHLITHTKIFVSQQPFSAEKLIEGLGQKLPLALVLPSYKQIKDLYDNNFRQLQDSASVFAEGYSGGINKMFYNFGLSSKSALVITSKLALRSTRQGVLAKTLILDGWPEPGASGVYSEAVKQYMTTLGMNAFELSVLEALHKVLSVFYSSSLGEIYIYGSHGEEPVADYLKSLGFLQIRL